MKQLITHTLANNLYNYSSSNGVHLKKKKTTRNMITHSLSTIYQTTNCIHNKISINKI